MTTALTLPHGGRTMDDEQDDGPRCGGCGRRLSSAGWQLCERCSEHLANDLLEVADRWARLNAAPSSEPGRYDKPKGRGFASSPPGRVHIMAMRDTRTRDHGVTAGVDYCTNPACGQGAHLDGSWCGADGTEHHETDRTRSPLHVVTSWATLVAEEREFTEAPPADMDSVVRWLNRQDDWIARWPEAGELARDVRQVRNALRTATGEPNPRPMASCIAQVYDRAGVPLGECQAPVFPPPPPPPGIGTGDPSARCSGPDRHEYTGADLVRLALANEQAKEQP